MEFEKQRKTFLSYSRVNKDFAIRLAKELKSEGFDVWLDQLDIPAGSRWDREVERALKESQIFMIILTPASVDSENVLDEIGYAIDNGKRFLPVLLENCDVPLRLRRFQYVDFTNKDFDDGVESAKDLLRGLIAQPTIPRGMPVVSLEAQTKAEADRKSREKADRLAAQKAKEEANRLATQKSEQERLAQQKTEEEQLAKAKADTDRKAKEEADRLAAQKAKKTAVAPEVHAEPAIALQKTTSKGLLYGGVVVALLVIAGVAFNMMSNGGNKNSPVSTQTTQMKVVVPLPTEATATDVPAIPTIAPENTSTITPSPEPTLGIGSSMISEKDGMTLLYVPAGEFTMGSDNGNPDEQPVHKVTLDAFWIDKTEVTNKMYALCVAAGACPPPNKTYPPFLFNLRYYGSWTYEDFPVIYVDWADAKVYCEWAARQLPTEAQWEKAARGDDRRTYPWGNAYPNETFLNFNFGDNGKPTVVGQYPNGASPYGALDMAGNVWEWVADMYSDTYYGSSPASNPLGPDSGEGYVLRGGSWSSDSLSVRSVFRNKGWGSYSYAGFRCAMSANP